MKRRAPRWATVVVATALCVPGQAVAQLGVAEVRVDSAGTLALLALAGYEVASVRRVAGVEYAAVVATPAQRAALGLAGFGVRAAPAPVRSAPRFFRPLSRIDSTLYAMASARALSLDTIGYSFEGRPILVAKLGPPDDAPARPNVLFVATHHAREWISTEVSLRLLEVLADSVSNTPQGRALLADRDVWVVPVLNPDGYRYSFEAERLWRKNRRPNADGTVGVDLNRNYPAFWGRDDYGSSPMPTAETFRGTGPASEPEVAALMAFHAQHPPDAAISYHSYTDLVLYPYGFAPGVLAPDADVFRALAGTPLAPVIRDGLAGSSRPSYHPGPAWQLYPTNGEYTEWAYRAHGTIAFTVELTAGCCIAGAGYGFEFPDDSAAIAQVVADNLPFALAVIEGAGALEIATGTGPAGSGPFFETLWPVVRLVGPPGSEFVPVASRLGLDERVFSVRADSLDRGRARWRWQGATGALALNEEIEVPLFGVRASLAHRAGAEDSLTGWTGWPRDSALALEGRFAWLGMDDTLTSPVMDLSRLDAPHFAFWARHGGSLFTPDRRGHIEYSGDGGTTWRPLGIVEGAAGEWYPMRLALPDASARARLRLISENMPWLVDAVHVFGTSPVRPRTAANGALALSENPVRSDRLFLSWAPAAGQATVSVLTFAGDLVFRSTVSGASGQVEWDLSNLGGIPVHDGAYVAVVRLATEILRRRVFVARGR